MIAPSTPKLKLSYSEESMERNSMKQFLPKVCGLAAVLVGGVAFAQGVSHVAPGVAPNRIPVRVPSAESAVRQRVIAWFTAYDRIRREAQMTPDERHRAHALMSDVLTGNLSDKQAGRVLLAKMAGRYVRASAQLRALPMVPQTADLQKGYEKYFDTGRRVFDKYLNALDSSAPQNALLEAQQDKYQMGVLDITNKVLDRKLRKEFAIQPYQES